MQTTQKFLTCKIKFGLHAIFNKFPGIYSLAVPNREDVNVLNKNPWYNYQYSTAVHTRILLCKMYYCISIKRSILCLLQGKINCHKQCVNQNFEFFILNSKAVLTFYSICNIFRNFEYTSYSICTIYFGNFNFNIFSYKRNPNSGKTKLACIVKRRNTLHICDFINFCCLH